ncbi:MOSC domain-containing protein [Natronosalvus rutilus]|uniref:MOSC N-terminal beta barrel domain-containing protein n=1 Tax=Natronosalvus rutilus TaxID=2953753 RepID=A0A9E7NE56_9EURY|nr:MOSC N-terminal beta barrel domain-containing protein [Natronosalvus rutilus]UTF55671.1 MOSC N-terminal beta barrel domain-containing protein [Natronosalvus rutilus]
MTTLSEIAAFPIKALDPTELNRSGISSIGGLENDRTYALVDEDGNYINGKSTDRVHRLRTEYDLDDGTVILHTPQSRERRFDLEDDDDEFESWLSEYFEMSVSLEREAGGGLTDGAVYGGDVKTGPTLVSEATLREVASWFDGIDPEEMRLRLRPNLVVSDTPPFWEDRLVTGDGRRIQIGDITFAATEPIPRCIVPARHPHTGEQYEEFQRIFVENREATFPEWASEDVFDHFFTLTVGLSVLDGSEHALRVGDSVTILDK